MVLSSALIGELSDVSIYPSRSVHAMKGMRGCLLVMLGFFGIFFSIIVSFTFYLLPLAFLFFFGSLILISFALGPADSGKDRENAPKKVGNGTPPGENGEK